jgi:digeranylgeranylglycerophospholipid reductase
LTTSYDVLVIGGGPAGLTTARHLAEAGRRVAVLEEHEQVGSPVNCSGILGVEAFQRFALPPELTRHELREVEFVSPRGERWSFEANRALARVVLRQDLDGLLASRAVDAGAEMRLGHRAMDVRGVDSAIEVVVQITGSKELDVLRSRALVVATGAGMPLLKKLGFHGVPETLLGVQTDLDFDAEKVEVYLGREWAPEGFAWIVPLGSGRAKVGLLCDRDGPHMLRRFLARPDVLDRVRGAAGAVRCSVLPLGFLPRSFDDRVLVVGEAAGHIKATTCGGIYYGMLTGEIAGDVLDSSLGSNRLDAGTLAVYEARWRELLEREIETGLKLRKSFKLVGDWGIEKLMALVRSNGIASLIREKADFDWHRDLIHAVFRHSTVGRILGGVVAETSVGGTDRTIQEYSPV